MANEIPEFIRSLESFGLLDSLLPFILIFAVLFAVLQKTKVIGEGRRQFNTVIALVISLMVIIPHVTQSYPPGQDIVVIINTALPQVSLLVIAVLAALLLIGVFAPGVMFGGTGLGALLGVLSMGAIVYIFGNAAGIWKSPKVFGLLNDPDTQAVLIIILVFGVIIWFVTRGDATSGEGSDFWNNMKDGLKNTFGGGR